jgi:hypothetical protein
MLLARARLRVNDLAEMRCLPAVGADDEPLALALQRDVSVDDASEPNSSTTSTWIGMPPS